MIPITVSNPVTKNITIPGKRTKLKRLNPEVDKDQATPPKMCSKVWPDIRLANNRIAKLNTLAKYDKISIKSKNSATEIWN